MAGNAVVGALRVTLGLDSAQFTSGMKNAQTGLQRFAGIAKAGALAIGSAMVAAGGAMALAMRGVIDDADRMYELSQSLGVAVEDLSRMRYAAELSGVSLEGLEKSIKKLSTALYDASQSATGPAAKALAALGISATDAKGNIRPAIDVIGDLAAKFETMPNGVAKTALAIKVFGKSGADMIPMLNEGRAGLTAMYEEAEQLGIVLDTETAAAAERFNDNLTRLGKTKDGIITKITAGMLPSLEQLSASMVVAARNSEGLKTVGRGLGIVMNSIIAVFVGVAGAIWAAGLNMAAFVKTMERVIHLDFAGAAAAWERGSGKAMTSIRGTVSQINALFSTVEGGSTALPDLSEDLEDVDTAAGGARRSVARLTDEQRRHQALMDEGRRTFEQTRTPAEVYAARIEELGRQLRATAIDQDTFNRAMIDARKAFEAADPSTQMWANTADAIRDAAGAAREDAAKRVADGLDNFRDLQEDAYDATYDGVRGGLEAAADGNLGQYLASKIREALFDNLATSITDLLRGARGSSGGGISGWASAAGSMFKSLAGGRIPGFATGGSFKVGGQAGVDKNLISFRATKGEMVDIRRPGQDAGGGTTVVHVNPSPYFDVQVERVAGPVASRAATQMGRQVADMTRRAAPAMQSRQQRLGTT